MEVQIIIPKFMPILVLNEAWKQWSKCATLKKVKTSGTMLDDGSVEFRHTLKSGHIKTARIKKGYYELL